MTNERYEKFMEDVKKDSDVSDKELDKDEKAMANKWAKAEDRNTEEVVKKLKGEPLKR